MRTMLIAYSNTCLITSLLWNIGGVKCIKNFVQFKHPIETFSAIKGKLQDISKVLDFFQSFRSSIQISFHVPKFTVFLLEGENVIWKRILYGCRRHRGWKRLRLIVYQKHILEAITHIIFTLKYFITEAQVYDNIEGK